MPMEQPNPGAPRHGEPTQQNLPIEAGSKNVIIQIPDDRYKALEAAEQKLAAIAAEQAEKEQAAREEQALLLAKKGDLEEALKALRTESDKRLSEERGRLSQVQERAKRYALDGELSRALAAQPLVAGGAEQLRKLWAHDFTVEEQGDSFTVRTPTFKPVAEYVAEQLAKPEYSHFLQARNPGGGTAGGTSSGGSALFTPPAVPEQLQPKNFSEAVFMQMADIQQKQGDPKTDMSRPFGLRRTS